MIQQQHLNSEEVLLFINSSPFFFFFAGGFVRSLWQGSADIERKGKTLRLFNQPFFTPFSVSDTRGAYFCSRWFIIKDFALSLSRHSSTPQSTNHDHLTWRRVFPLGFLFTLSPLIEFCWTPGSIYTLFFFRCVTLFIFSLPSNESQHGALFDWSGEKEEEKVVYKKKGEREKKNQSIAISVRL